MFCNFEKNLYSSKAHVNYKCGQNLEISDREIWNSIQYYLSWYEKIGCTAQGDMGVQAVSDPHGDTKGTCLGPCISRGPVRPLLVHSEGDKGEKRKKKDETKWNLGKKSDKGTGEREWEGNKFGPNNDASKWMNEWMNDWMNEWMNEWMNDILRVS